MSSLVKYSLYAFAFLILFSSVAKSNEDYPEYKLKEIIAETYYFLDEVKKGSRDIAEIDIELKKDEKEKMKVALMFRSVEAEVKEVLFKIIEIVLKINETELVGQKLALEEEKLLLEKSQIELKNEMAEFKKEIAELDDKIEAAEVKKIDIEQINHSFAQDISFVIANLSKKKDFNSFVVELLNLYYSKKEERAGIDLLMKYIYKEIKPQLEKDEVGELALSAMSSAAITLFVVAAPSKIVSAFSKVGIGLSKKAPVFLRKMTDFYSKRFPKPGMKQVIAVGAVGAIPGAVKYKISSFNEKKNNPQVLLRFFRITLILKLAHDTCMFKEEMKLSNEILTRLASKKLLKHKEFVKELAYFQRVIPNLASMVKVDEEMKIRLGQDHKLSKDVCSIEKIGLNLSFGAIEEDLDLIKKTLKKFKKEEDSEEEAEYVLPSVDSEESNEEAGYVLPSVDSDCNKKLFEE